MTTPKEAADKAAASIYEWPDFGTNHIPGATKMIHDSDMDRDALRRWYKCCIGMAPNMKTGIGHEARQLLLDQITSDLAAVDGANARSEG